MPRTEGGQGEPDDAQLVVQEPPGYREMAGPMTPDWKKLSVEQRRQVVASLAKQAAPMLEDLNNVSQRLEGRPDLQDALGGIAALVGRNPNFEAYPDQEWQQLKAMMAQAGNALPTHIRDKFLEAMKARKGRQS